MHHAKIGATPNVLSETDILRSLTRRRQPSGSGITLGIGDDCAIFRPPRNRQDLLFTTDLLVENVHFRRETHSPADIGHKTLARGLSDLAAMGAKPHFCLLSLALAPWCEPPWLSHFYDGLFALARRTGITLAGGDLSASSILTCDIVACGSLPQGRELRRDGARVGDKIFVSGQLGGSAHGLATGKGQAWKRHLRPEPRLKLGLFLRKNIHVSACMDLSDGLSLDLHRLAAASNVAAAIDPPPRFRGASLAESLHGGEDYELLFTVRPGGRIPDEFEKLPLTRIGTIVKGRPGEVFLSGTRLPPLGFDHFSPK